MKTALKCGQKKDQGGGFYYRGVGVGVRHSALSATSKKEEREGTNIPRDTFIERGRLPAKGITRISSEPKAS